MLTAYLDQKAVLAHGPRLLPRLFVRPHRRVVELHASDTPRMGRPSLISDPEVLTLAILAQ
jgi:hypothetical protein